MQIHVVRQGQSLYSIAEAYNTTVKKITDANQINEQDQLVIGQALVIPIVGRFYWVLPGDTLPIISRRVGITTAQLARVNNISLNTPLKVGQKLYIPPAKKTKTEVNGYVEPQTPAAVPALEKYTREVAPLLTYLAPFSFQIKRDGSLQEPELYNFPSIANNTNTTLIMVVTNLENDQFSDTLGALILNDEALQNKLLTNIVATAKKYNFKDIHFDMEYLRPQDREAYNQFLRKAKQRFHQEGWLLSTALAPKTSAMQKGKWYEAHDYKAHGEIVDFVVIMTYEWGYSGGPAMAVSPINQVRKVLEYAVTEIPSQKIMMGQNLYGYDWTLPFVEGTYAKVVSPQQAIALARQHNAAIEYDTVAQAPHFSYRRDGKEHVVWFEDARSIQAKFNLLKELKLRGISYWKLGLAFPQNWLLIQDNFQVVKRG